MLIGATTPGSAQVLHTLVSPNEESNGRFGKRVCIAGHVNHDSFADVIVGAYGEDPGASPDGGGRAYVFSGFDGTVLFTLISPNEEEDGHFGAQVSGAGDVDGDGCEDVLVGAEREDPGSSPSGSGRVYVFSGADGSVMYTLASPNEEELGYFGHSVSDAGDVNNDGHDDVVVGAIRENPGTSPSHAGRAYTFSGMDGSVMYTFRSPSEEEGSLFGCDVSGAGDVDGDGYTDVVVGAMGEGTNGRPDGAGRVYVFSGEDGSVLHALVSPNEEAYGHFGGHVACAGDVDNDGFSDVIVGAKEGPGASPAGAGRAYVFSGVDGSVIYALASPNEESYGHFGADVSGGGDVNADGHDDIVVGAPSEDSNSSLIGAGRAYVFSGMDGSVMYSLVSPNEEEDGSFGISVSGGGDVDNDEYDDVIIGAYGEDPGPSPSGAGRAYVFSGFLIPVELAGFTGAVESGKVILRWATLSEHENFGFHVYRSPESINAYVRITDAIIPGAGNSCVRHDYSYTDEDIIAGGIYSYKLADIDFQGQETLHGPVSVTVMPSELTLHGAYPNPSNNDVAVRFSLGEAGHVRLDFYNLAGELVRMLADGEMEEGLHELRWDGTDESGRMVPPGAYTYQARSRGTGRSGKLILIQ